MWLQSREKLWPLDAIEGSLDFLPCMPRALKIQWFSVISHQNSKIWCVPAFPMKLNVVPPPHNNSGGQSQNRVSLISRASRSPPSVYTFMTDWNSTVWDTETWTGDSVNPIDDTGNWHFCSKLGGFSVGRKCTVCPKQTFGFSIFSKFRRRF